MPVHGTKLIGVYRPGDPCAALLMAVINMIGAMGIVRGDRQGETLTRLGEHGSGPPCLSPANDATVSIRLVIAVGGTAQGYPGGRFQFTWCRCKDNTTHPLADTDLLMPLSLQSSRVLRTLRRGYLPDLQTSSTSSRSSSSISNNRSTPPATSRPIFISAPRPKHVFF